MLRERPKGALKAVCKACRLVENRPRSSDALVNAAKSRQILQKQRNQLRDPIREHCHREALRAPLLLHSRSGALRHLHLARAQRSLSACNSARHSSLKARNGLTARPFISSRSSEKVLLGVKYV